MSVQESGDSVDDTVPKDFRTVVAAVDEETRAVEQALLAELGTTPRLDFLFGQLGSYLWFVGQRLNDLREREGKSDPRTDALSYSVPRLFNECFAAHRLASSGLALQATVLLRAAFEVATQAVLFIEDEASAQAWLSGHRNEPREVREKLKL